MTSQVRRAAVSVPAHVAEGQGRFGEAETLLQFDRRRRYIDDATLERLMNQSGEVGRIMIGLIQSLRKSLSE
jgi:hypothetical protein